MTRISANACSVNKIAIEQPLVLGENTHDLMTFVGVQHLMFFLIRGPTELWDK